MSAATERLEQFFDRISRGASRRAIADAAGLDPSTLTRQLSRGRVPVQTVVAVCRAYGADLVEGFLAAGYVSEPEAERMSSGGSLESATDEQLVGEILRRLQNGSASGTLTEPIPSPPEGEEPGDVVEFGRSRRPELPAHVPQRVAALYSEVSHHDADVEREELP
ncbi:helix-turn-helix transcriptional regulator [Cellulosimicrobium funkei]|uniref:helix-turn-helix domain-containing protein n=1 Tax=Cellulosimicrobium funkei TaxID=264251 RepID=UPI003757BBDA